MNARRVFTLLLTLTAAGALLSAKGPVASGVLGARAISDVRLKTISMRVGAEGASLVIEATEPVGYVATRPDPFTVALDFRNVDATGVANQVTANAKSPIAGVAVEASDWLGAPASRVRITLSQAVVHHVRSNRNTIVIDFDKASAKALGSTAGSTALNSTTEGGAADALKALDLADASTVAVVETGGAKRTAPIVFMGSSARLRAAQAAAVLQQQPATPAQGDQSGGRRAFTGSLVSLDFQGADLRAVIRTFSEISGLNIVIDPLVMGSVDVQLREVPWDQALDLILRSNKLGYSVDGTIVRIAPVAVLASEEKERADLAKAQQDAGPLVPLTRSLSYSKGAEIVALLKQGNILSSRGQAFVDERTNTLLVTDLQERLTNATDLIDKIDKPQPQVEIEARIVQTNKNYARQLGVQWGFNGQPGNNVAVGGRVAGGNLVQGPLGVSTAVNQPVGGATSAVGLALGSLNSSFNLDVALSALETSGNGRILSTPKVSTLNNVLAEMTQGIQIPYQVTSNNTVTIAFKDAALKLLVTPQITASNTIIMLVNLENATPDFGRSINGIPPINTQRAVTQVLVSDGQTTVIGGIYTSTSTNTRAGTPGLTNVPLLGWLFRKDTLDDQNTELLIFITPRIIRG